MNKFLNNCYLIGVVVLALSLTNKSENSKEFKIIGSTIGFPDSTVIFLDDASGFSFIHMDSAYIVNGKFKFSGSIKNKVLKAVIRTYDFSDFRFFWLENSLIKIEGEKGKFRQAFISGSKVQIDQDILDSAIRLSGKEKGPSILFIRSHPSSIISAEVLSVYCSTWGRDTSTILYNLFSKELKNTSYAKIVGEFITLNKNLIIGDKYVDFSEPNIYGKVIKLSDFDGKLVLLDFWGSWCGPCRQGNHELVKIYREFKDKGFDILGVAAEVKKEEWIEAVQKDSLTWENVTDLRYDRNKAAIIYGVSYYPSSFLIDRNGTIVARDLTGEKLRQKLKELLKLD